jgi:hypothetical protein
MSKTQTAPDAKQHNPVEYTGDFVADDNDDVQVLDMMVSDPVMQMRRGGAIDEMPGTYDYHGLKNVLEYEKFMREPIVVKIHKSTDKNASPVVPVGINGDFKWLPRGIPIRIPRCFVERLAQSQATSYRTVENTDRTSDSGMLNLKTTAHEFPFDVVSDPSRFGRRWLQRMMRQG